MYGIILLPLESLSLFLFKVDYPQILPKNIFLKTIPILGFLQYYFLNILSVLIVCMKR